MAEQTRTAAPAEDRASWLNTRTDGLTVKAWIAIGVAIAVVVVGFGAWWTYSLGRGMGDGDMSGMNAADVPRFPPVAGYYNGERIFFIHTEASDAKVADMLTGMMDSPVVVVPELAEVPDSARGVVYVFTNGTKPDGPAGPFGFQPDVSRCPTRGGAAQASTADCCQPPSGLAMTLISCGFCVTSNSPLNFLPKFPTRAPVVERSDDLAGGRHGDPGHGRLLPQLG